MNILETLGDKSWIDKTAGEFVEQAPDASLKAKRVALNFFLGVVSVLFSLFIVTFLARSQYPDFKALAGDSWQPLYNPIRLWVNTGILLIAGLALQAAVMFIKRSDAKAASVALGAALVFTLQFLAAQVLLWQHLQGLGFYITGNPATSYFYVLTAAHAVHVLGGFFVLALAALNFWRRASEEKLAESLILCSRYWHFLFGLWLILFALMVSSPGTYKTLAALCGY